MIDDGRGDGGFDFEKRTGSLTVRNKLVSSGEKLEAYDVLDELEELEESEE